MQTETPAATLVFMPRAAIKGRGTAWAIEHRFTSERHELFDDGWGTLEQAATQEQSAPGTQIIEQTVKSILSGNDSPDIPFDLSINPYRGCEHGCVYCFARPTHSYLNLSPGLDFETKIIAKVNAVERLRATLSAKGYEPLPLNIGSATDAYQPVERRLRITRGLIEVLAEFRHGFSIITKSSGIERDIDLLAPLDGALARIMEPRAASPERRVKTIETLARAGIPVGVSVSPMIPFINEPELERVLERAREAGATSAFATVLRLPWEVNPLFQQWLTTHFPERAARVMARVHEMRGGRDNDPRFQSRMTGQGVWSQLLSQRFKKAAQRLGFATERRPLDLSAFRRPVSSAHSAQASLF
jgi:DNA repair photolyase